MVVQGPNLAKTIGFYRFLETYLLGRFSPTRQRVSKSGRWMLPRRIPKGIQRWIPKGIQIPKEQDTGNWGLYAHAFTRLWAQAPGEFTVDLAAGGLGDYKGSNTEIA